MLKSNLKVLLAKNDMNQKKFAKKIDVHELTISKLVNNKFKTYPCNLIDKICKELNCDVKDIILYIPKKNLSSNLLDILDKKNMSQEELAQTINEKPTDILRLINLDYKTYPSELIEKICNQLDCDAKDVLNYKAVENQETIGDESYDSI